MSDLTFITNEKGNTLKQRFDELLQGTKFFDCLVGYFYVSGFYKVYKSLETAEKIRILVGINTNKETVDYINIARNENAALFKYSAVETKESIDNDVKNEMENSQDSNDVEEGIRKFIEWIKNGKLQIKAYQNEKIHAKIYIMTFKENNFDKGRVITGSSNFTQSGLVDNLEFNVELKNVSDYEFALKQFGDLWEHSVDISDQYVKTITEKTWLKDDITPYELYLKFLYEYFKEDLDEKQSLSFEYLPEGFKKLEYQEQAVINAKKILETYGGVFISDVVGLGKTYISAMLAHQLSGRTLVIAPPALLKESNPGSWKNVFIDFQVPSAEFESRGKLDHLIQRGVEKFDNIIIDEAHGFRTETTKSYEKLAQICRGKKVILVTATPYNNYPKDILSQIKLFQNAKKSTIPNLPNLEKFFNSLQEKLKNLDRKEDYDEYMKIVKDNSKDIRERVLKYLMVRRTRKEIEEFFEKDLKKQKLKFPKVEGPYPIYYQFTPEESEIFDKTIELAAQKFKYSRYTPLLYLKEGASQPEEISQKNMRKFMRILLVKRLESSFFAFNQSIKRFIWSYERFIKEFEKGKLYISKKYSAKIYDYLDEDNDQAVVDLIEEGKAYEFRNKEFNENFIKDLKNDLKILKTIQSDWKKIKRDPKLIEFIKNIKTIKELKENKLIIFTESQETANYLAENLEKALGEKILCFTGSSGENIRNMVIENFDAKCKFKKNDYRILVATEVLAEGVNLHQANVVINYDIPWNPTRMMQRVGRINRVDTSFDKIYTYNCFPTDKANNEIKLKEAAESKINAFLSLLGGDSALLTEDEQLDSHKLFNTLFSNKALTGEEDFDNSELKYLKVIKDIKETDIKLFEKIVALPKKARSAKESKGYSDSLITFFRVGMRKQFFISSDKSDTIELDPISAVKVFEADKNTKTSKLSSNFWKLLAKNTESFVSSVKEDESQQDGKIGRDTTMNLVRYSKMLYKNKQFSPEQLNFLKILIERLNEGAIPKPTSKNVISLLEKIKNPNNQEEIFKIISENVPKTFLGKHYIDSNKGGENNAEIILSESLI